MIPPFELRHTAGHRLTPQSWVGVAVGVGGAVIGGMATSSAAGQAADAQRDATAQSNALQQHMFDTNVALNQPVVQTGNAARDRLSYLLGLSPTGYSGASGAAGGSNQPLTYDQLRSQLVGQYTRTGAPANAGSAISQEQLASMSPMDQYLRAAQLSAEAQKGPGTGITGPGLGPGYWVAGSGRGGETGNPDQWVSTAGQQSASTIDEAGLDAAIKQRLADQEAQRQAQIDAAKNDPNYGRLSQQFEFDKYTPDLYTQADPFKANTFSYTGEDLYKDPSYLFRLQQGQKALDRQGAASGRFLSGAQLQASSNYNQGAASQEFQNAYQRALGTFGTNESGRLNEYNTNETNRYNTFATNSTNKYNAFNTNEQNRFNAYQANFANSVNPLLSLAGSGQVTSQFLGGAGQQTAQLMGNNITNNANAQGAAGIAQANSFNQGLSNVSNTYQQNQLMNSLLNRGSVNNNPVGGRTDTLFGSGGFYSGTRGSGD